MRQSVAVQPGFAFPVAEYHEQTMEAVRLEVQRQIRTGGRFALTVDTWKTKGRRKRSYLAVLLHYVTKDWEYKELCPGVLAMDGKKDQSHYTEEIKGILRDARVEKSNIFMAVSDHEPALRAALEQRLGFAAIGCECHFLQLPAKHAIPPI